MLSRSTNVLWGWSTGVTSEAGRGLALRLMLRAGIAAAVLGSVCAAPRVAHAVCPGGWEPVAGIAASSSGATIYTLVSLPGGDLLAGGLFTDIGAIRANALARYTPGSNSWADVGVAINSSCLTIVPIPGSTTGQLVVGGYISSAGSVRSARVAKFTPSSSAWADLNPGSTGPGANTLIRALEFTSGGDLILGGLFTNAGDASPAASNIARFSASGGGAWSAFDSGVNNWVNAVCSLPTGDVIVGGEFTTAGGTTVNRLARLNPATGQFSAFGTGVAAANTDIRVVVPLPGGGGGDFIVAGRFSNIAGVAASNIARYTASTNAFTALGSGAGGVAGDVNAVLMLPSGDLIVGGTFSSAGGTPAARIAQFDVSAGTWSALESGITGTEVKALALASNGDLFVAGDFTAAGGMAMRSFARYVFGAPCPADLDCSGAVTIQDLFNLLNDWFAGNPAGNYNGDCCYSVQDIFDYLSAFFSGCV